jgi:hypothetical protein
MNLASEITTTNCSMCTMNGLNLWVTDIDCDYININLLTN